MVDSSDWFHYFQKGEEQAFRQVFEKYYRPIMYFAEKILRKDLYVEDIVSETFSKAWNARTKFATPRHLENFLYLVTRNACISKQRATKVQERTDEEWVRLAGNDDHYRNATDAERSLTLFMQAIYARMQAVDDHGVLRMAFLEGKSTKEIAMALNTTENAVYLKKSRLLKELRKELTNKEWLMFVFIFMPWLS